jgi:site-specific DNA-cytosine methylase
VFNSSEFAPQNRERVYVIIDTQGGSAPEILFDPNTEKKFVEEVRKK